MKSKELLDHRLKIIKNLYVQLEKVTKKMDIYKGIKGEKNDK